MSSQAVTDAEIELAEEEVRLAELRDVLEGRRRRAAALRAERERQLAEIAAQQDAQDASAAAVAEMAGKVDDADQALLSAYRAAVAAVAKLDAAAEARNVLLATVHRTISTDLGLKVRVGEDEFPTGKNSGGNIVLAGKPYNRVPPHLAVETAAASAPNNPRSEPRCHALRDLLADAEAKK